jgi:hypothetical protein
VKAFSICLLIWLGTVVLALVCGYARSKSVNASLNWPATEGVVEVAQVDQAGARYWPKLHYSYQVNNTPYTGHSISNRALILDFPYTGSPDPGWAHDQIARYSPGQQVTVHYDPAKPCAAWLVAQRVYIWQCVPLWGFLLQLAASIAVMQRLFVTRKGWLILTGLLGFFVLWVCFFVAMRPPD